MAEALAETNAIFINLRREDNGVFSTRFLADIGQRDRDDILTTPHTVGVHSYVLIIYRTYSKFNTKPKGH